ncbi:hypothetical protein ZTR_11085 [Talaromyces verruculosus]|nr:hypothetical protein ZTR_11085 [Talaromyces verruculosus]
MGDPSCNPDFTASGLGKYDLTGKTCLITGVRRSWERALRQLRCKFESLKSDIVDSFRDSENKAPDFIGVAANILDPTSPEYLAGLVEEHFKGELNILVNNACYDEMRNIGTLDDEYVQKVLYGNIHQPVMLMDILYRKRYIKPYSRIINVSSLSGRQIPYPAMYLVGASKATLEALTRSWATFFANDPTTKGTTVNSLLVGATATDAIFREAPDFFKERARNVIDSGIPILGDGGIGRAEDVADVAGLLVSENARWITGGVICANGGQFPSIM